MQGRRGREEGEGRVQDPGFGLVRVCVCVCEGGKEGRADGRRGTRGGGVWPEGAQRRGQGVVGDGTGSQDPGCVCVRVCWVNGDEEG